jgi:hypothetical protein
MDSRNPKPVSHQEPLLQQKCSPQVTQFYANHPSSFKFNKYLYLHHDIHFSYLHHSLILTTMTIYIHYHPSMQNGANSSDVIATMQVSDKSVGPSG